METETINRDVIIDTRRMESIVVNSANETIIFQSALSDDDRSKIKKYLREKYNINNGNGN